ncbi:hypothetical protein [Georgenia sp. AZ-5]|uniref:hypothetical protein n=1 Tax=Georgenia sp. AZ-5 TaxID=3367526 RepID=UPI0037548FF6
MWWLVWVVLVLVALGVGALLALRLWRQVKALGRELAAAAELGARLSPATVETPPARVARVPGPAGDAATLDLARRTRDRVRGERAARRRGQLARAAARWHRHGLAPCPPDLRVVPEDPAPARPAGERHAAAS